MEEFPKAEKKCDVKKYKKACRNLLIVVLFMYGMMMGSKNVFTAEIIEIRDYFNIGASETNLANTFYYITYALLQIILVTFIDKVNLRVYLGITVTLSAVLTMILGFVGVATGTIVSVWILFGLNGFFQAAIYAASMRIFSANLPKVMLPKAVKLSSSVSIIANALSYGVSAIFVSFSKWELPFFVLGLIFLISSLLFFFSYPVIVKNIKENEDTKKIELEHKNEIKETGVIYPIKGKKDVVIFYFFICFMSFIANSLYFAVNTWFPSLLYNVYGVPKSFSILITLFVPLIIFLGSVITVNACEKQPNVFIVGIIMYSISFVFSLSLVFFYDVNIILAIFLEISFLIIANGTRSIYSGIMAMKMRTVIDTAKFSLISNAVASVAAGVSPTIIGYIFDNFGWMKSYLTLFIMDVVLVLSMFVVIFIQKHGNKSVKLTAKI